MDDLERRQTEMLLRANSFGVENNNAVKDFTKAVAAFAVIQTAITGLDARGVLRSSAAETKFSHSARRKLMRNEIYDALSLIARTAIAVERGETGFVNKFRLPQTNRSDLVWLETARAFIAELPAVEQLFLDYGLPAGFIAELTADANEFEAAIGSQDASNRDRIEANAAIDDILADALQAARTLKIIVPNIFRGNAGKLADWASASHVEKAPKKIPAPSAPTA